VSVPKAHLGTPGCSWCRRPPPRPRRAAPPCSCIPPRAVKSGEPSLQRLDRACLEALYELAWSERFIAAEGHLRVEPWSYRSNG
jgi:hypothetical protein